MACLRYLQPLKLSNQDSDWLAFENSLKTSEGSDWLFPIISVLWILANKKGHILLNQFQTLGLRIKTHYDFLSHFDDFFHCK